MEEQINKNGYLYGEGWQGLVQKQDFFECILFFLIINIKYMEKNDPLQIQSKMKYTNLPKKDYFG